jgi:RimJ/RimL family protein N-acetyltransferase
VSVQFRPMRADDAPSLELQASQQFELGLDEPILTAERGADLATHGVAWTALRGEEILCCSGFREIYAGHAVAWAAFTDPAAIGAIAGGRITAFARDTLESNLGRRFHRIEALIEADNLRALEWAKRIGLEPAALLRKYGAEARDHILFERVA